MNFMGFKTVTEMPGNRATKENIEMLYTRYKWALQFVDDKDVLEVGCGGGQGLGYLAQRARKVVGGDVDEEILNYPKEYYKDRIKLVKFGAEEMPFENNSFDVVILFETIYYLENPQKFLSECRRVLRENGLVLVCQANPERLGFNKSPFTYKYFSASEFKEFFQGFDAEVFGAFKIGEEGLKGKIISIVRNMAVRFHLIPKTMKWKGRLKRLFLGKLESMPDEVQEGMADYEEPILIDSSKNYKVLFVKAKKC